MALVTLAFVCLILLIVVVLLVLKVTQGSTTVVAPPVAPAPAAVVQATTSLPAALFDEVGAPVPEGGQSPLVLGGRQPLVIDGHPGVVYLGAEFCPYCAAERWALVVALGRFGTFSGLGATSSSKYEVFPSTATFSFDGATYHSRYVSFSAVEEYGASPSSSAPAGFPKLQSLSALDQSLLRRYQSAPALEPSEDALPFVDVAGRLVFEGSDIGLSPAILQGDSMGQIAADLSDPTSPVSVAVVGEANYIAAAICSETGELPTRVCGSGGVQAAAVQLGAGA